MWSSPVARACDDGGGPAPAITGTRAFYASGSLGTCNAATPTTRPVTIDFGANTVTAHGTGSPSLDEKTFDATIGRNEVHATVNRASEARPMTSARIDLDLGPGGVREIELDETLCADGGPTATCHALTHLERVEAVAP